MLVAALVGGAAPVGAEEEWHPRLGAARSYADSRAGSVTFAVIGPRGRLYQHDGRTSVPSASVVKAMLLVTYLRMGSVRDRRLTDDDRDLLRPMIRWSDNDAATRVADTVGERRIERLANDAGMKAFSWTRPWGLSQINAVEQARFFFKLERYIPARHEAYARYLLSHIVPSQRWGIASLNHPNWTFFFKGGWGSGTGWVNHQVGFFERDGRRIAIAVTTRDSPSHDYASQTLRGVGRRLLGEMPDPQ
ncbi:MAG: hypothetical protein QOH26_137 [Actinomycetota bacterium]|nr:hypothetical protein [Actinomycetota bacterium]